MTVVSKELEAHLTSTPPNEIVAVLVSVSHINALFRVQKDTGQQPQVSGLAEISEIDTVENLPRHAESRVELSKEFGNHPFNFISPSQAVMEVPASDVRKLADLPHIRKIELNKTLRLHKV